MMEIIDRNPATVNDLFVIVDNCFAHILDGETLDSFLKIEIIYLPPRVTSVYQPCDYKLFYAFKHNIQKSFSCKKSG